MFQIVVSEAEICGIPEIPENDAADNDKNQQLPPQVPPNMIPGTQEYIDFMQMTLDDMYTNAAAAAPNAPAA